MTASCREAELILSPLFFPLVCSTETGPVQKTRDHVLQAAQEKEGNAFAHFSAHSLFIEDTHEHSEMLSGIVGGILVAGKHELYLLSS